MRATTSPPLEQGSLILAQRASGPFRVAICREHQGSPDITIRLDRLDEQSLSYQRVCSFASGEWGQAVKLLLELDQAIPEASRSLRVQERLTRGRAA